MNQRSLPILLMLLFSAVSLHAAAPSIEIGTLHGQLKFDKESFHVKPGVEIKLTLKNTDEMQHNLIICSPGKNMYFKVAQKAWALGAKAIEKHFVPDMPEVLHFTKIVDPGKSDAITFTTPTKEGDYPYVCTIPGHAFTMKGIMHVAKSAPTKDKQKKKKAPKEDPRFIITATDHPVVKRAFVQEGPARSIMVGFPGGINACFDADSCSVASGWFGRFLDVGPDWGSNPGHRGGKHAKILGNRFETGSVPLPIRIGSQNLTPQVKFKGYDWNGKNAPTFHFTVNGSPASLKLSPATEGIGFLYEFSFPTLHAPVFFLFDDREVSVTSTQGWVKKGFFHVPEGNVGSFTLTVVSKTQG